MATHSRHVRRGDVPYLMVAQSWGCELEEALEARGGAARPVGHLRPQLEFKGSEFAQWFDKLFCGGTAPPCGQSAVEVGSKLLQLDIFSPTADKSTTTTLLSSGTPAFFDSGDAAYTMEHPKPPFPSGFPGGRPAGEAAPTPPGPRGASMLSKNLFSNIACVFKKPPPDASEREMEEHNFIKEGLMYFDPPATDETAVDYQVHLVSGVFTLVDIVSHITSKRNHPSDTTGPPIVKIGKSLLILAPLTNPDRVVRTVYLLLGAPETAAESHLRYVGAQFRQALLFLLGPLEDLFDRVSETTFDKAIADAAADVKRVVCPTGWHIPSIPYTPSSTSALTYRLGGKCVSSTLGAYVRASSLLERVMDTRHEVLGAALFHDPLGQGGAAKSTTPTSNGGARGAAAPPAGLGGAYGLPAQVLAYELPEGVLKLVRVAAAEVFGNSPFQAQPQAGVTSSSSSSSSSSLAGGGGGGGGGGAPSFSLFPPGNSFTTTSYDGLWLRINPTRHAYKRRLSGSEEVACFPVWLSTEDEDPVPCGPGLFPSHMREVTERGAYFGLYLQRSNDVCCAVLVGLSDLWLLGDVLTEMLCVEMAGLDTALRPPQQPDDGDPSRSFVVWSAADESISASNPTDTALLAHCAQIKFMQDSLREGSEENNGGGGSGAPQQLNRFLLYKSSSQQYVSSRKFAGSQSFFFTPETARAGPLAVAPKIGTVEDIAKFHLGPFPCLI